MTFDERLAHRAAALQQDYAEEGRSIGRDAALALAEQQSDEFTPPDVRGMCDADAWNVLDRWCVEHTPPPDIRDDVERQMDMIVARIQDDGAQWAADAADSRALVRAYLAARRT